MIAIIDYGMGNVRSMYNALEYIGCDAVITSDESQIRSAERVILPGVGAFGDAMDALRARGLDSVLNTAVRRDGKPMLGICLGMQLLAQASSEHGSHQGLGWFSATIERFELPADYSIPHVGWNSLSFDEGNPLFAGLKRDELNFYFVHSYYMKCRNDADVVATCDYGGEFAAVVCHDNVAAMQFHPEKSQDNGIRVLQNFVDWKP